MPGPLVAIAAGVGTRLLGAGLSRLIGGRPKIPDLVQPAVNAAQNQVQNQQTAQRLALQQAEEQAARAGGNVTAAREDIVNASGRQQAALRAGILDTIARANQQQEIVEADIKNRERQQLMQGIQGGFNAAGAGLTGLLSGDPSAGLGAAGGTSEVVSSSPVSIGEAAPVTAPLNPQVGASAATDPVALNAAPVQVSNTMSVPDQLQFVPSPLQFRSRLLNNINS